jgi:type IV pilus assembly protein PilY1
MTAQRFTASRRGATLALALRLSLPMAAWAVALSPGVARAQTALADQPVFITTGVPGNLALALSVEFPTAVSVAHTDPTYDVNKTYLGYFDPNKCYLYNYSATETDRYFYPSGSAITRACTGTQNTKWSGNFLNWATMQTIDPFRWALTGGYRVVDTSTLTLIEKAWASGQGGSGNFPNKALGTSTLVANNTPLTWATMTMRIQGLGNKMRFTRTGDVDSSSAPTVYNPASGVSSGTVYELSVRVKVCDSNTSTAGPLESNCTAYPAGNYKPTGLLQQYAAKIRYSAFGYLNDDNILRDGGVLRARQKFIGPTYTVPTQPTVTNTASEWDANTGVFTLNPDASDATTTSTLFGVTVSNSGVINYLNKFGQLTNNGYKTYDPVSELYYAAIRYFKNLGNVPEWTSMTGASSATKTTWLDGFPVITTWDDPIQYSCQKNFILGIGDVNTHADKNVAGNAGSSNEPTKPATVTADTTVNAVTATNKVGALHGLGASLGTAENYNGCCNNNSALMAGLAYDSNTKDIRPDDSAKPQTLGKQTVQTYWLDVLEYQTYKTDNQYYLAAKYGGFKVPAIFDPYTRSTDIPMEWWSTSGELVGGQPRPDNYFVASAPDTMVAGLTRAFSNIAAQLRAYTTSFATVLPQVSASGVNSYATQYDAGTWTGELTNSSSTIDATTGEQTTTQNWAFSAKLGAQLAGTGWDTGRRVVTMNTATGLAVPFRSASLSAAQLTALDTIWRTGNDSADYLNYLRGDTTHEEASTATSSSHAYRTRALLLGDIVTSKARPVGPPTAPFSSAANPGYAAFKSTWATRTTMVYVGANDGMLHAVNGAASGAGAGSEVFAYVPGDLYQGASGVPVDTGLMSRGDPDFTHVYLVDGPVGVYDVDMNKTSGASGSPNWKSMLVGGLGKGGKSYYAIDVTDPGAFSTETAAAGKVLWEFRHADLGFTYGEPAVVKTRQYGWVLVFGSGYNNADGKGYFFIVNPRTGALLQKVGTGVGSTTAPAGMAHVQAYVQDRSDNTADAVYAGDLLGNLWRLDLTAASGTYPAPVQLAALTNTLGSAVPITSRPLVVIQPGTNKRWVTVGSGKLLASSDISSTAPQGFFAIQDGTGTVASTASSLPTGITFPIRNSNLLKLTDLTTRITLNAATQVGWWLDLGVVTSGYGWRVISDASSFYGMVSFAPMVPGGDVCSPTGKSRLYSIDLGTGQSKLLNADGTRAAYLTPVAGVITDLKETSVNNADGTTTRRLYACDDTGQCKPAKTEPLASLGIRRLNWRELPVAD